MKRAITPPGAFVYKKRAAPDTQRTKDTQPPSALTGREFGTEFTPKEVLGQKNCAGTSLMEARCPAGTFAPPCARDPPVPTLAALLAAPFPSFVGVWFLNEQSVACMLSDKTGGCVHKELSQIYDP